MAIHSSVLALRIPGTGEPGGLPSMGSHRVGHDWATSLSCIGEENGNPLQCSCLENPRDRGAWWAAIYGAAQSRTWLTRLSSHILLYGCTIVCYLFISPWIFGLFPAEDYGEDYCKHSPFRPVSYVSLFSTSLISTHKLIVSFPLMSFFEFVLVIYCWVRKVSRNFY